MATGGTRKKINGWQCYADDGKRIIVNEEEKNSVNGVAFHSLLPSSSPSLPRGFEFLRNDHLSHEPWLSQQLRRTIKYAFVFFLEGTKWLFYYFCSIVNSTVVACGLSGTVSAGCSLVISIILGKFSVQIQFCGHYRALMLFLCSFDLN